jgi:imidazolonepropionase-like amidohydrolase
MRRTFIAAAAAALLLPIALHAQVIAITGGRVHPVSGPVIENGTVLIRDGRIAAVGASVAIPADARRIDATGKVVTPGLVNASTLLGLQEIASVPITSDRAATGRDRVSAAFSVWEGFNPRSAFIHPTRSAGVTTAVLIPVGGLVSGRAAVAQLVEGSARDMILRQHVAMVATVGDAAAAGALSRGEVLLRLRELLQDARAFRANAAAYERGDTRQFAASRLDLQALGTVLDRQVPLLVNVNRASDIESALALAREFNIRMILAGAAEGWMVARQIAEARVPVITGAMSNIPLSFSTLGMRQENAALLRAAGVEVAITGNSGAPGEETYNVRNVRFSAGNAVAYGMSWEAALRAITLAPAEIFGVADRVGSLQPGRDGDVVVWNGDPFEFGTLAERVFVRGSEVQGLSGQDLLEMRYRQLPPDFRRPPRNP